MKKLLTILTLLMAVVMQGYATDTTTKIYPVSCVMNSGWAESVQISSSVVDNMKTNDVITVYVQDVGENAEFQFQSNWSSIKTGESDETIISTTKGNIDLNAPSFSLTITSEILNLIKGKEMEVKGVHYTITKIILTSGSTETALFGAMELNWSTGLQIEADNLPSMVVGDVLKAEFDITGDSPQGQFKYGSNWDALSDATDLTSEKKCIELTITEDIKTTLSTNKLVVSGQSCRLTKLSLIHTTYTLTIPSLTGGTIMIGNETAETKSYDKGTTLTLTATPNTGYDFNEWSSPSSLDETAKKNASLEITLNDDITAEATFVKKTFTLSVSSSNTDWGTASITTTPSAESYEYGTSVTVRAEPNNGYKFVNWTDTNNSDTEVSTNEEYTFEINTNTSLKANFASNQYTFSVTHENGSVKVEKKDGEDYTETSETTFDAGTELKLTASPIADSEYYFSSWSSNPDNVLTINGNVATLTLNQDTEVTATFSNVHDNSKEISVSNFEAMSPATFSDGTLTTSATYQGIQEWIGDNSSVKGSILEVKTESNSRLKIVVGYTDGTETSQEEPGEGNETTSYSLNLSNKYIQKVMIQSAVTGDVKFTSIVLDPKFTLTVSQPTGGKIMIGDAVADATKDYVKGTSVTLTAVADGDYTFSNWVKDEQNAGNNTTLEVVMNAATSVSAVFTPVGNTTALTDGTTSCWGGATSYDIGTKKVTYKEQYAGFQSYYSSEKQKQASRLYLEFDVAVKLRVLVGYTDGYQSVFNAGESEVTSRSLKLESSKTIEKLQIYYDESLENDASKEVTFNQAYFDNETGTEDASSLKAPLDLSQFIAIDNATYSTVDGDDKYKIKATASGGGVKYSWNTAVLKGTRLSISTSDAALYDVVVSYSDETSATYKAGNTGAASRTLKLESNKLIKEIQILATAAGDITLSDAYVDLGDASGAEEPTADFVLGENESELTPTSGTISTAVAWGEYATNSGLTFGAINGKAGDVITVYGTSETSHQIQFQTAETDWGKIDKNADGTFSSGKFVYTLTGSTASLLRDANLFITGYGFTPEHVTLTAVGTSEYAAISEVALANFDNMDDKGSKQLYAGSNSTISAKDKKLVVTTSSDSKLKVAVYLVGVDSPITEEVKADGTAKTEYSVSLGSDDKKIKKIVITNNGDAEVTYSSISLEDDATTETAVFDSNGKADLNKFVAAEGATYDTSSHVISGSAWKDVKLTIPESEAVKGAELALTFDKAANVKVYYTCGETTYDLQTQSKEIRFTLESDKVLTCVNIQSAVDNQNITLQEVAVNSSATNLVDPTGATISTLATELGSDGSIASEEVLSKIIADDKIRITYDGGTSVSHQLELQHKDSNWSGTAIPLDVVNSTAIEFTVSEGDMLTNIQAGRLYVSSHENATISKVERITTAQETDPNEQDLSATINTGTDGNLTDAYAPYWKFLNAAAADKINVYVSDVAASTSYSLKGHGENGTDEDSGWTKLEGTEEQNALETSASKIEYTLTDNSLAYVKAHGLYLKSETGSFKVSKIAIISETAIPTSEPVAPDTEISLAKFAVGEDASLNKETGEFTTTGVWKSIQQYIGTSSAIKGSKLVVKLASAPTDGVSMKVAVGYVGESSEVEADADDSKTSYVATLDNTKAIEKVYIQLSAAGTVTIKSIVLDPSYTVTVSSANEDQGTAAITDAKTSYAYGDKVELTATKKDGYKFKEWTIGDTSVSTDNPYTLTVTDNVTITAVFETDAVISDLTTGENAVVQPTSDSSGTEGITVTSGSDGVEVTTSSAGQGVVVDMTKQTNQTDGEDVQGKRAVVEIKAAENSTIKVTVNYTDGSKEMLEKTITATASARGKALTRSTTEIETTIELVLDPQKKVSTIEIQNNTEASSTDQKTMVIKSVKVDNEEITKSSDQVTKNFVSLIDRFGAGDEAVTYSEHVMTTTVDNKYIQAWISSDNISGKRLVISATGDNPPIMDILVQYNGENEKPITYAGSTSTSSRVLKLDDTKTIQKVQIYLPTKGSVTFNEIYIDNEDNSNAEVAMFKLTTTSVNGQITVKKVGETANTADREFEYGTQLTLTATANEGYEFVKWMNGETELTANSDKSLSLTMDADVTIEAVFKLSMLNYEDSRTLWTGSENLGTTWPAVASQSATVGDILEEGEKILITVSSIEKDSTDIQVTVRSADYEHTLGFSKFDDFSSYPAEVKLILSAGDVTAFKSGFHITGKNCTVTKVVLYKPTPVNRTERTLLEKTQAVGDGIEINRGIFSNAAEEDVLKVYFEVASGTAKINLEDMNYNGIENSWPEITTSPYTYIFSAKALSKIKASGLRIRGENFTFKKATLYTANELGSEIIDSGGDDGGDDNPQPTTDSVIDTTTGEVNTEAFQAMGDNATFDAETGVMTTTEPWAGVQAWFNEPESVPESASVIVVNIGETNNVVQVTVGYTDGTESLATSTVGSSIRQKARRAGSSGIDIIVPVDPEKEIQKIMIQAAEPGTITINSITARTQTLFTDGKVDLSMLKAQGGKVTYDTSTHTMATTAGWTGVSMTVTSGETVKGVELYIRTTNPATMKMAVEYADGTQRDSIMTDAASIVKMQLDATKLVKTIYIQPTAAAIIQFQEISVNATHTPDIFNPVFTNGKADLSRLVVQDADRVMYNAGTHKMVTTDGWIGVQLTPDKGEKVSGAELMVKFAEPVTMKLAVVFSDGSQCDTIMSEASKELKLALDNTLEITQIQLQPTSAAVVEFLEIAVNQELTPDPEPEPLIPVFDKNGKADLSRLDVQDANRVMYNKTSHKLATTDGWVGVQLSTVEGEKVSGAELMVKFAEPAVMKLVVAYSDGSQCDTIMSEASTELKLALDNTLEIAQIQLQPTSATVVELLEIAVNQERTPDPEPEPVVPMFDKDGKADLSRLEVQDADRVMYNTETHKMATTDGWVGVQFSTVEGETATGAEIALLFAQPATVKLTVKYTDETLADTIMSKADTLFIMPLDIKKPIAQVQIQPTSAGVVEFLEIALHQELTPIPEPVIVRLFDEKGQGNLSVFEPMSDNAEYDQNTHVLTTMENWAGVQVWLDEPQTVNGNTISVRFAEENANARIVVGYTDGSESAGDAGTANATETGTEIFIAHDSSKEIQKMMIQMPVAGKLTLTDISSISYSVSPLDVTEKRLLWKNDGGETLSWNDIAKKGADYGAILETGEMILVTVKSIVDGNEWPKLFLRDAQSEMVGEEMLLNGIRNFPYQARFTLDAEMKAQMADGFSLCGDGVVVTRVELYKPEPPKEGDINLVELNGGWNSTYDAASHTITTTARWAARGWDIGDARYNDMDVIIVRFEPVAFPVTLKIEYTDAEGRKQATSNGVAAGNTAVEISIPKGIQTVDKVYLVLQNPGSVTLTAAEVLSTGSEQIKLDLGSFEAMGDNVTYDNVRYTMTSADAWGGIQLWLGGNTIDGGQLIRLTCADETAKVRLSVGYTDGTETSVDAEGSVVELELDDLRSIQKVAIQNQEAGTLVLKDITITARTIDEVVLARKKSHRASTDNSMYSIGGSKVNTPNGGLYIQNGKKVVVK